MKGCLKWSIILFIVFGFTVALIGFTMVGASVFINGPTILMPPPRPTPAPTPVPAIEETNTTEYTYTDQSACLFNCDAAIGAVDNTPTVITLWALSGVVVLVLIYIAAMVKESRE